MPVGIAAHEGVCAVVSDIDACGSIFILGSIAENGIGAAVAVIDKPEIAGKMRIRKQSVDFGCIIGYPCVHAGDLSVCFDGEGDDDNSLLIGNLTAGGYARGLGFLLINLFIAEGGKLLIRSLIGIPDLHAEEAALGIVIRDGASVDLLDGLEGGEDANCGHIQRGSIRFALKMHFTGAEGIGDVHIVGGLMGLDMADNAAAHLIAAAELLRGSPHQLGNDAVFIEFDDFGIPCKGVIRWGILAVRPFITAIAAEKGQNKGKKGGKNEYNTDKTFIFHGFLRKIYYSKYTLFTARFQEEEKYCRYSEKSNGRQTSLAF